MKLATFLRFVLLAVFGLLACQALFGQAPGTISTVAGAPWVFPGNGWPAAGAQIGNLQGVAVDIAGTIYIADPGNNMVFKVVPGAPVQCPATICGTLHWYQAVPAPSGILWADASAAATVRGGHLPTLGGNTYQNYFIQSLIPGDTVATPWHLEYYATAPGSATLYGYVIEWDSQPGAVTPSPIIQVLAGNGTAGYSGDGGPATSASFNGPSGIAVYMDAYEYYVYVSDTNNHAVRLIDELGGITTYVGTGDGTCGYGDNITSTGAHLCYPHGLALSATGRDLYIADEGNHAVRQVNDDHMISTVAGNGTAGFSGDGGMATLAQLWDPLNLALDASGNLYIADQGNRRVRMVTASGNISTFAGTGDGSCPSTLNDGTPASTSTLGSVFSVAADQANNVYIGTCSSVWRVSGDGVMHTFAGLLTPGFAGDGAAAAAAYIFGEASLAVDGAGTVYIADDSNYRLRRVDSGGTIGTYAGNGLFRFAGDGGPAASATLFSPLSVSRDANGNFYVAEEEARRVRKISASGNISVAAGNGNYGVTGDNGGDGAAATLATLKRPGGAVADSAGNIYIAEEDSGLIRKVDANTGLISTIASGLSMPLGLAVDGSGSLYFSEAAGDRVGRISVTGGAVTPVAGTGTAGYSGDGSSATAAQLFGPKGLALTASGDLYIADAHNNVIRKIHGGIISTVAGDGTPGYSGDGGPATTAQLNAPYGVTIDASGNLFIADKGNSVVRMVGPGGTILTVAGGGSIDADDQPAVQAWLNEPTSVLSDLADNLYIVERSAHRIRKVTGVTAAIGFGLGVFPAYPAAQTVEAGGDGSSPYAIVIAGMGGFAAPVSLSCSGLPAGVSCSFSPNPATTSMIPETGANAMLTLTAIRNAAPTTQQFTITGTSGSLFASTIAAVQVTPPAPLVCPGGTKTWTAAGSGNWSVAANWLGGTLPGAADDVCISGAAFTVTVDGSATVHSIASDASIVVNGSLDIATASQVVNLVVAGTLSGAGSVTVTGVMNWTGGTISGAGSLDIDPDAALSISGGDHYLIGRALNNIGNVVWSGFGRIYHSNGAAINNLADATFNVQDSVNLTYGGSGANLIFTNAGTLTRTNTGSTFFDGHVNFTNSGTVTLAAGGLQFGANYTQTGGSTLLTSGSLAAPTVDIQGGALAGVGTITANVTNAGQVNPGVGVAPGRLTISGTYTQGSAGVLNVDIAGPSSFDVLEVIATANLAGTLNVNRLGGYSAPAGTSFPVLTFSVRNGDFASKTGLDAGGGNTFQPTYNGTSLNLAVPPPAITSLTPPGAAAGGAGFTLTVTGSDFQNNSVVRWNGSNRTTTYVSATQLTAAITAPDIAIAGTVQVTVLTPPAAESAPSPFTISGLASCANAPSGMVAWFRGDGTPNDSAYGIAGTPQGGATYTATGGGRVGQAFSLNGSSAYVSAPDSPLWAFGAGDFSITLWANWNAVALSTIGQPTSIFVGNDEGPGNMNKWGFSYGGGVLDFFINGPSLGAKFLAQGAFNPSPGTWYHLAVTRTNGTYTIYVNGLPVSSEYGTDAIPDANAPLTIGQAETLGYHNGLLDEIQIYRRALPPGEIQNMVNAGGLGVCPSTRYDARADLSTASDPSGPWSYGYSTTLGTLFHIDNTTNVDSFGFVSWYDPSDSNAPGVGVNPTGAAYNNGGVLVPVDVVFQHPGPTGYYSVVRFTAPIAGEYLISGNYRGLDNRPTSTDGHVMLNTTQALFDTFINSYNVPSPFSVTAALRAGDTIDFALGWGSNHQWGYDTTGLQATISNVSTGAPAPAISGIAPSGTAAGGAGFTLTVNGSDFVRGSIVRWNGADRPTTFVAAGQLTAAITAADIALMGSAQVTVYTPGMGTSAPVSFAITGAAVCSAAPWGLVSWWPAEGNAQDLGAGNNGSLLNGATFAPGRVNQAFTLDGVSQQILVPFNASMNPAGSFSVAAWFKADSTQPGGYFTVVDKSQGFTDGTGWALSGLAGGPSDSISLGRAVVPGELAFGFGTGGSTGDPANFIAVGTGVNVADNAWHQAAGVFDGAQVMIYLDGVLKESRPWAAPPVSNTRDLRIGASWGGGTPQRFFKGLIDEVQYVNRALSFGEIQGAYNAGTYGTCTASLLADLNVTVSPAPTATVGSALTYAFMVNNNGPVAAPGVVLTDTLPAGVSFVSGTSPQGTCSFSAGTVTCNLGSLQRAYGTQVFVTVTPTLAGSITNTAAVSAVQGDPNTADNFASVTTAVAGTGACTATPANLVSWWPAEGNANDLTGANSGMLVNGVTFATGIAGQAFSFSGANYVQAPNSPSLAITGQLTIDAWVNPARVFDHVTCGRIVDKATAGAADGFVLDLCGGLRMIVGSFGGYGAATVPANVFTHVAGVFDGSQIRLYINGQLDSTFPASGQVPVNSLPLRLGVDSLGPSSNGTYTGLIDEVHIFSRALSIAEIQAIYNAGGPGLCATPGPTLTGLSPVSVTAGSSAFTLTVNGSSFVSGATVFANGSPLTTTFVSSTQLTAAVPSSDVAAAGHVSVSVQNPGSFPSTPLTFVVAQGYVLGTDLLANPDAEAGAGVGGDGTATVFVPGWSTSNGFTVATYGLANDLRVTDPGSSTPGNNYFRGGAGSDLATATQIVDLSAGAATIDGGALAYLLGGYLGGWQEENDNAVLTVVFKSGSGNSLGVTSIGPVIGTADRAGVTGLAVRSRSALLPVNTRTAEVTLSMNRTTGPINNGYADSLFFGINTAVTVGDVYPSTGSAAGQFGDGAVNNVDLVHLFRVTMELESQPSLCSDRFAAMDAYPVDSQNSVGGDNSLDNMDLIVLLNRVVRLDTSRPVRPGGYLMLTCAASNGPQLMAGRRPGGTARWTENGRVELGAPVAAAGGAWRVPINLTANVDLDLAGLSYSVALPGYSGTLRFVTGDAGQPSLLDAGVPGMLAAGWLNGLKAAAGNRLLLGYVEVSGSGAPPQLQIKKVIANASTGKAVPVGFAAPPAGAAKAYVEQ